jgi:hypothetical protein
MDGTPDRTDEATGEAGSAAETEPCDRYCVASSEPHRRAYLDEVSARAIDAMLVPAS